MKWKIRVFSECNEAGGSTDGSPITSSTRWTVDAFGFSSGDVAKVLQHQADVK